MSDNFKADATTMNALFDALGGVVMCLAATMPPQQRQEFAAKLQGLARGAEKQGNAVLHAALSDMHRAASA